eukprot:6205170-Pleurochrysis_carterae.AAC.3
MAGSTAHPFVEYVHDFKAFFADYIYDEVESLNTARSFFICERDDGGKLALSFHSTSHILSHAHDLSHMSARPDSCLIPESSHKTLYPVKRGSNDAPLQSTVEGEQAYITCPYGIEIFKTKCAAFNADGPLGFPVPAPFAKSLTDTSKPRIDVDELTKVTDAIIGKVPDCFTDTDRASWADFWR